MDDVVTLHTHTVKNMTHSACVISEASCRIRNKLTPKLSEREKPNVQYVLVRRRLGTV